MLQLIRSRVTSIFVKALFVMLIASFAIWGIGDIFLGSPSGKPAVEVSGIEVTSAEVIEEFDRLRQSTGLQMTAAQAAEFGLLDRVIEDIANRLIFIAEGKELGLEVSEDMIRKRIAETPAFRDQSGQFSADRFRQVLYNARLTEAKFVELVREEIVRDQLVDAVTAGLAAPKVQADMLYRYRNEKRAAKVVVLDAAAIADLPEPSAEEIAAHYEKNKERYRAPEYRGATAVVLNPATLAGNVKVEEAQIREAYDTRQAEFRTPARRTVDQIFFADEATAKKGADALAGGKSFEDVAKEIAGMDPATLSLGSVTKADLTDTAMADAVFGASKGGITGLVKSDLGWHIFRIADASDETVKPYDEVKAALRDEIARTKALDVMFEVANRIEDALAAGETIEETAKANNVAPVKIEAVDNAGRGRDEKPLDGIARDQKFRSVLFSTRQGDLSKLEETAAGGYFILRVDSIAPAAQRPLDEIKAKVAADLVAERRANANLERAQALVAKATSAGGLEAAAKEAGLTVTALEPFTRQGEGLPESYPADLASIVFDLKQGDIAMSEGEANVHVAELTGIVAADPAAETGAVGPVALQVRSAIAGDAIELLLAALKDRHEVTIDKAPIDAVIRGNQ